MRREIKLTPEQEKKRREHLAKMKEVLNHKTQTKMVYEGMKSLGNGNYTIKKKGE